MKKIIEKSKQSYNRLCIMLSALMLTAIPAPVMAAASVTFVKTSANNFQTYALSIAALLLVVVIVIDGFWLLTGGEEGQQKVKKWVKFQVIGIALMAFAPKIAPIIKDIFSIT